MAEDASNLKKPPPVVFPQSVLQELRSAVLESFTSGPHGGQEVYGVLFGTGSGDAVRIEAFQIVAFQSAMAGATLLSPDERNLFAQALSTTAENHPVGWFRSHPHSELALTPRDIELSNAFFPDLRQVVMILRPGTAQPSRLRFFYRASDGSLNAGGPFHEFTVPLESGTAGGSNARDIRPGFPEHFPPSWQEAAPSPPRRGIPWVWTAAMVAVIGGLAAWYWLSPPPERLALSVLDRSGQLLITWAPVPNSAAGHLEINDGGTPFAADLGPEQLRMGSFTYTRRSENVNIRLEVSRQGAAPLAEATRFFGSRQMPRNLNPPGSDRPPQEPALSAPPPERNPGELVVPVPVAPPPASRIVNVPVAPPAQPQEAAAPPAPVQQAPAGSESGRVIWIGRLQQHPDVVINGKFSSSGTLIGALPGKPVSITLAPGVISSDGIVLYTANRQYAGRAAESPGPGNAWHKTAYIWNPGLANSVTIKEGPGPRNQWNRLVMRSADPAISVVAIEWTMAN